jgi:glycosyltransferase involved in cell wall biosynthesis
VNEPGSDGERVSIVVPVYGFEEALPGAIEGILRRLQCENIKGVEIVVVHAPRKQSDSEEVRYELGKHDTARVVTQKRRGYRVAYMTGFREAKNIIIVTLDAGLTYRLDNLCVMISRFNNRKPGFLNTNRLETYDPGAFTWSHGLGNLSLARLMNILFRTGFNDSQSGMWVIRREKQGNLKLEGMHMEFPADIKIEARLRGLRCAEYRIKYVRRQAGSSTNTWREGLKIAAFMIGKKLNLGSTVAEMTSARLGKSPLSVFDSRLSP